MVGLIKNILQKQGILDAEILRAMLKVSRDKFVAQDMRKFAYNDSAISIGYGQTISQPYMVAFMTKDLQLKKNYKVLEIGTGSGYQAAILSGLVDAVYTIEIIPELGVAAKERFECMGYDNIHVKLADGYFGWKEKALFDAIIVTAAVEYIPPLLIEQLKEGGRMIVPVGNPSDVQQLIRVVKTGNTAIVKKLIRVRFVPFTRSTDG